MIETFRERRKRCGYTQAYLASQIGVKQSTVAMWESGESLPSMKNLIKLSELMNESISALASSFPKRFKTEGGE